MFSHEMVRWFAFLKCGAICALCWTASAVRVYGCEPLYAAACAGSHADPTIRDSSELSTVQAYAGRLQARPLFERSRRPLAADVVGAGQEVTVAWPRLTGLINASGLTRALLEDAAGHRMTVEQGGSIAGWTVQDIGARQVTLTRGEAAVELRLRPASPRQVLPSATSSPQDWRVGMRRSRELASYLHRQPARGAEDF